MDVDKTFRPILSRDLDQYDQTDLADRFAHIYSDWFNRRISTMIQWKFENDFGMELTNGFKQIC